MPEKPISARMIQAAKELSAAVDSLRFSPPVAHVYNPLTYAWKSHETYLKRFGNSKKRVVFLGMNPGPFGMMQTGVPFGEITAVRDWMGIEDKADPPAKQHPKRPIQGFACKRSEISGKRLWGLFAERFGAAEQFFKEHLVLNYCPLAFLEESGRNRTPAQMPARETAPLFEACDLHLRRALEILQPDWLIGVGGFAMQRVEAAASELEVRTGQILHPSPASPAANRDWSGAVTRELERLGVWPKA